MPPQRRLDNEFFPLFEQICSAYADAPLEGRMNVYLCIEGRDNMLDAMLIFGGNTADKARTLAITGKRDKALPLLKQAIAANAIVDERGTHELVSRAEHLMIIAAEDMHVDLAPQRKKLVMPVQVLAKQAVLYHQQAQLLNAAKALGIALHKDQSLEDDPKLAELAKLLTRRPAKTGMMILREPYLREKFIAEAETHKVVNRTTTTARVVASSHSRFWPLTVGVVIALMGISAVAGLLIGGAELQLGNILVGLAVGLVLSTAFTVYRLRGR
jgi:hypothetical protein